MLMKNLNYQYNATICVLYHNQAGCPGQPLPSDPPHTHTHTHTHLEGWDVLQDLGTGPNVIARYVGHAPVEVVHSLQGGDTGVH